MIKPGPYNSRMIVVQYGVCSYSSRSCIHTHVHVRTSKRGQACDKQRKSDCCQTSSASVRVGSLLLYIYAMCNYDPSTLVYVQQEHCQATEERPDPCVYLCG